MAGPDNRAELERLQRELQSRESITHFAHAAVSLLVGLIVAGAAGKLFWDLPEDRYVFAYPVVVLALSCGVYALVRYFRGRRTLAVELERFEALKRLRTVMKLDDPSALLPQ